MEKSSRRKASGERPSTKPSLVLIVDDFDDGREMYAAYLRIFGVRVEEASNGEEAIEKARSLHPDLIFMDLSMPGIDGWAATRILKNDPATSTVRIVALTGRAFEWDREKAREVGCDSIIVKPCMPEDLLHEMQRLLPS